MRSCFVTNCYWVNIRSFPNSSSNAAIIATLPHGHECTSIEEGGKWWKVKTEVGTVPLEGYINSYYLTTNQFNFANETDIAAVHLSRDRAHILPSFDGGRAHPIGDPKREIRDMSSTVAKVASIHRIINYLNVEQSERYLRNGSKTYCNVYAYDYCYLAKVYIPRIWWTGPSLIKLSRGESVPIRYADTVAEIRANDLFYWLKDFGPSFGWRRVFTAEELQQNADRGGTGLIVANTKDHTKPGHICAVVPQTSEHRPVSTEGTITTPITSQAGGTNYNYRAYKWWTHSRFSFFGFFVND